MPSAYPRNLQALRPLQLIMVTPLPSGAVEVQCVSLTSDITECGQMGEQLVPLWNDPNSIIIQNCMCLLNHVFSQAAKKWPELL